jgi:hypothetical protein
MAEPTSRMAADATRTGFLPTRSASRPETGIATAAPSSVAVTTHDALLALVRSRTGSSLWIGMTSDCMSAAQRLLRQRTATTQRALAASMPARGAAADGAWFMGSFELMCNLHKRAV